MRDAMTDAAAVFEPEEVVVLAAALRRAIKKLDLSGPTNPGMEAELARLVHNLGRSRVRLRKPMLTHIHAAEIADDAVELFVYLEEAPDAVLAAARENTALPDSADRVVGLFPNAFRQLPAKRL